MFKKTIFTVACLVVTTAAAFAKEVTIPTARGEVTLPSPPAKIAVFDSGSLDTLQALGVKVDGAPDVSKILPYLKQTVENAKNVGTMFEPNMEALNELRPDLIIVGTRSAKKLDEVSVIAKTIDLTDNGDKLIESGLQRIDSFGKLFNKETEAATLKNEITTLFNQTKEAVKGKGNGLIILVNGGKISAFGSGYRLSWIHNDLGVPMADESIKAAGQEGKSAKDVLDNELVRQTKAWKNNQIIYLSAASYLAPAGAEQIKIDLNIIKAAFEKK